MLEEKDLQAIAQLMDARLDAKLDAKLAPINDRLDQMQADLTHVKALLDYDVDKRLNALAEGQSVIEKRLDTLNEVKKLVEETRDKVDVIHAVVAQHSGAITELKKVR